MTPYTKITIAGIEMTYYYSKEVNGKIINVYYHSQYYGGKEVVVYYEKERE